MGVGPLERRSEMIRKSLSVLAALSMTLTVFTGTIAIMTASGPGYVEAA